MLQELLKNLGFSQGEITVFSYLTTINEISVKEIALNSGISLSKTYEILEKLKKKQLISEITRNNVKCFRALPLDAIGAIIDEKKKETQKEEIMLKNIIKNSYERKSVLTSTSIRVFSGYNGIKTFYKELEHKDSNDEYLGFMFDDKIVKNKTILRLIDNFHKLRSQNNRISKVIIEKDKNFNSKKLNENEYPHYIFKITSKPFPKNLSVIGDKVLHYNFDIEKELYEIIEIESSALADIYKTLFESLFRE